MIPSEELNKLVSELAEKYSIRVKEISSRTSSFSSEELKEL